MNKILISWLLVTCLVACSSKPTMIPLSGKNEVIYNTLYADAMMNTWRYECSQVSTRSNYLSQEARTSWWQRNGELVKSADFGLAYNIVTVTDSRADTGAKLAMSIMWDIRSKSQQAVADKLSGKSNQEAICLDILNNYKKGKWDIKGDQETQSLLNGMKAYAEENKNKMDLRRAMISSSTRTQYGRSFYIAEKFAEQQGCNAQSVRLVKGEWPNEIYDLECTDKPFILLRCEWGSCRAME